MSKKVKFIIPRTIKHAETRKTIQNMVDQLTEIREMEYSDIPNFHRMATAYDMYLDCSETIAKEGSTFENIKGEIVKRPEVGIQKDSWAQYLEIAKEYGFTAKSKGQIKALQTKDDEPSVMDKYIEER